MSLYQHILLAVDFTEHGNEVASKAKSLAKICQADLSIVHVLDNIPMPDTSYGTIIPLAEDSDNELLEIEKARFIEISDRLGVAQTNRWLIWGAPKQEITQLAEQMQADLIVVGSHGRHGLALLLGSTANAVLHHARCDVLAVRLQDE